MAIFNSKLLVYQRVHILNIHGMLHSTWPPGPREINKHVLRGCLLFVDQVDGSFLWFDLLGISWNMVKDT
jgi:hypothetical protein